jgi:hypothetical protein
MASGMIRVASIGLEGVCVNKNPLELSDGEVTQAQNATTECENGHRTLKKRPGLIPFNTSTLTGSVLGGIGVPLANKRSGTRLFYIGRGTV